MDCSLRGFSVQGIFQAKNTGVGSHSLLQGIFLTQQTQTQVCCIAGRFFTIWATICPEYAGFPEPNFLPFRLTLHMGAQSAWMWTTASHEDEQEEVALVRDEDLSLHMPLRVCMCVC